LIILKILWIVCISLLLNNNGFKKEKTIWKNNKCAVVLTYDDALSVHLDKVLPVLDSAKIKATFYVYGNSVVFQNRIDEWKSLAMSGHELGNHSLFHPCNGNTKGNEWVKNDYDLQYYSIERLLDELKLANTLLKTIDGKNRRTYAYPCGDKIVENKNYKDTLQHIFPAARGTTVGLNKFSEIDLYDIKIYPANDKTGDELIRIVQEAKKERAMVVFMFHGVGGGHELNISLEEHNKFIRYLNEKRKSIWTAPLIEIVEYLNNT
jgi:peptidoglycan-N-acetylglucosamine deacetylase